MDLVRIGFIGLGNITQTRHLPALRRIGGAVIMGGADINRALLTQVAERNRFELLFSDYHDLIQHPDIDAIYVNLPTHLHAEVTVAALQAGKHVFCEKPFAMNLSEAHAMAQAARQAGRHLMISNVQRYAMRSRLMKQHLHERARLGNPYYIKSGMLQRNGEPPEQSWFARREQSGGGVLMDQGPGMLDQLLWLLDYPKVSRISGFVGRNVLPASYNVEDTATLTFEAGGVTCLLELAWSHSSGVHENLLYTDVFTTRGGIRCRASWSNDGPPLMIFRRDTSDRVASEVIQFTPVDAYHEQNKHFIDSIRTNRPPENTPEQALAVLAIISDVYAQCGLPMIETPTPAPFTALNS